MEKAPPAPPILFSNRKLSQYNSSGKLRKTNESTEEPEVMLLILDAMLNKWDLGVLCHLLDCDVGCLPGDHYWHMGGYVKSS